MHVGSRIQIFSDVAIGCWIRYMSTLFFVHYRDISEGRHSSGSISLLSTVSTSTFHQSPSSYAPQYPGSTAIISELSKPRQSPGSVEDCSDAVIKSNGMHHLDRCESMGEIGSSYLFEGSQALQRLEEQLSLNDDNLENIHPFWSGNDNSNDSDFIINDQCRSSALEEIDPFWNGIENSKDADFIVNDQGRFALETDPFWSGNENSNDSDFIINDQDKSAAFPDDLNNLVLQQESVDTGKNNHQALAREITVEHKDFLCSKEILDFCKSSTVAEFEERKLHTLDGNGMLIPHSSRGLLEEQERCAWLNFDGHNSQEYDNFLNPGGNTNLQLPACSDNPSMFENPLELPVSMSLSQEVENFNFPACSPVTMFRHTDHLDYLTTLFDQGQIGLDLKTDSRLTIAQKQKFTVREMSPEWGYAYEATKVVIVGSFPCDPSEVAWTCMFGDIEVPVQIIQEGVICCLAPPCSPGKVTLCITSGNRESCSEDRVFEYRVSPSCGHCSSSQAETTKSREELLLLARFVRMLLSDPSVQNGDITESVTDPFGQFKAGEDSWGHVINALLDCSCTLSGTTDWLLQELLKDKLQQWLSSRSQGAYNRQGSSLSRKAQGVIHIVAGLGFDWALNPILDSGVSINFRDINGWSALHWAARFGRNRVIGSHLSRAPPKPPVYQELQKVASLSMIQHIRYHGILKNHGCPGEGAHARARYLGNWHPEEPPTLGYHLEGSHTSPLTYEILFTSFYDCWTLEHLVHQLGAVTDPNPQDPTGKTPAYIAATSGHKGLAGYLSEVALTTHLSSLTLEENEKSKCLADVEAEYAVNSISQRSLTTNEDEVSLKDTLAAVRNSAQAASRIQAAFRELSFRRRQQREAAAAAAAAAGGSEYECNILVNDITGLSAASKLAFGNARDCNKAALAIQKKYRGWKGRKNYIAILQKVVKIQAHVRGYQARKQYKIICWAVSVLEKVILRWRRKGVGLRGFRPEMESIDESEDEDILKLFRKQNVDTAINEAVSRVLSMVDSLEARQQYRRLLERYRQVKVIRLHTSF
ncbi:calmodulin-binding transcription activator protein with CG-1 and Ankyrin domain [Actinidia rufa]|uniref:Calmodulin-binding transcription activator protein with CG-1 and Ankyrin domain n=1 Tax=Actinidia rufa TaxID=165716 RepID=A0A7J0EQ27_9ERIC|nr:calmodulin-binding transcription activator protein with CG-1 and Ankyrin domain [Actinidia rufa]